MGRTVEDSGTSRSKELHPQSHSRVIFPAANAARNLSPAGNSVRVEMKSLLNSKKFSHGGKCWRRRKRKREVDCLPPFLKGDRGGFFGGDARILFAKFHHRMHPHFALPPALQAAWPLAFGHRFAGASHGTRNPRSTLPLDQGVVNGHSKSEHTAQRIVV